MAFKPLNWKECEQLAQDLDRDLRGGWVDRVLVPARPRVPGGFLKSEWALRIERGSKAGASHLLLSVRPRHPYAVHALGRGPQAAAEGTRSVFDLQLGKLLQGARVQAVTARRKERLIRFEFQARSRPPMDLSLWMVPATPALVLTDRETGEILAQSGKSPESNSASAPEAPSARDLSNWAQDVEAEIDAEARALHVQALRREAQALRKRSSERAAQSEEALRHAAGEPDWQAFGHSLQAHLYQFKDGGIPASFTGIPLDARDPKLDALGQMSKFFQLAKRKTRRADEARARLQAAQEGLARAARWITALEGSPDWPAIDELRNEMGLEAPESVKARKGSGATASWPGKSFRSAEGLTIWVGRSRAENLELTFRHARGNDLWMHLRGKPGAHVIIPLNVGKSASLETLLDAASLALQYSGGAEWGKTEVDYTFRKHVKRISRGKGDSQEVSYTNNKTLIVAPDPARLKRLLGSG